MKDQLIPVRPKNYRRIALAAIATAARPVILMDRKVVTDFTEAGPVTQAGIRRCRDFEIRDGAARILGFHDHPDEMWITASYQSLAEQCAAVGWLTIQEAAS